MHLDAPPPSDATKANQSRANSQVQVSSVSMSLLTAATLLNTSDPLCSINRQDAYLWSKRWHFELKLLHTKAGSLLFLTSCCECLCVHVSPPCTPRRST